MKTNVKRFFRSVRLDSDIDDINNLGGYTLTNQVLQVLNRIMEGLSNNTNERAFTLIGPYGSGKSAFALFLAHLLENHDINNPNLALKILQQESPQFATDVMNILNKKGLFPVALTLHRAPLAQSILEGLISVLKKIHQTKRVGTLISLLGNDVVGDINTQLVKNRIETFMEALPRHYQGMVLVLDELDKALEYAARHTAEDVYLLQELAEFAARSSNRPFLLVGILHQSFEQIGEYLAYGARQEWAKVQGRFCDIAFIEPPEQQMRLAFQAIRSIDIDGKYTKNLKVGNLAEKMIEMGFIPSNLEPSEVRLLANDVLPLHITVLFALPYLFKRFAQNERSLFAYLLSSEPFGLQDKLMHNSPDFIRLPDLYDYFLANVSGGITKKTYGRPWIEVADALERTPDLTEDQVKVLKTIGLLSILGEISFMQATKEFICIALYDELDNEDVQECLKTLQKKSLIVFRRYNNTYRIWEGSDIDIEERLNEGRRKTLGLLLGEDLQKFLPAKPMVASRHSHNVGAMRFFELRYTNEILRPKDLSPTEGMDGIVICCLPYNQESKTEFIEWAQKEETSNLDNVIIVVPSQISSLREVASELRAIHWVWQNTPELRDDRIARRELAERTVIVEGLLTQAVQHLLDPRLEPYGSKARWYYKGREQKQVINLRAISELLSTVMDQVYRDSPVISNELINRRAISAAASGARRNLVERMLTNGGEPLLGIEGYPPERSIYDSVLKASGLHQEGSPFWQVPGEGNDPLNLLPTFKLLEKAVFGDLEEPYSIGKLLDELAKPPIGIMPGVFPILLVAFIQSYPDHISLYREGVFIPEPNIADFEILMRRPELYSMMGSRLKGERAAMISRIAKSLKVNSTTVAVARALIGMVKRLPPHAWRTEKLSEAVIRLRGVIEQARSPERLLFVDLPQALEEEAFSDGPTVNHERIGEFFNKLNDALQEWGMVTEIRIKEAKDTLLRACDLPVSESGWQELITTAQMLKAKPLSATLTPFVNRLTANNDNDAILESVLALIAERPPRSWTDHEVDNFPMLAKGIADEFIAAAEQNKVLSEKDEALCNAIMDQLKHSLGDQTPPHVVKVALYRLLQDY